MDMDGAFRVFVKVADTESFSAAAKQLGMGQPAVSKQISALEDHLGARLLHRTTRSITLTDEGRELLDHARHAVAAIDHAVEQLQGAKASPKGLLRLSSQTAFARMRLVPHLARVMETFPELELDLVTQDTWPNLVEQGIDLRIHIGDIEDDTVIAQLIGHSPIQLFASRSYVEKHGRPERPEDLSNHLLIHSTGHDAKRKWTFTKNGAVTVVDARSRVGIDNLDTLREAVLSGVGICSVPQYMFSHENMDIVPLLPDYDMGKVAMYVAYPSRRFVPLKVRLFIDYIKAAYRDYEEEMAKVNVQYNGCC